MNAFSYVTARSPESAVELVRDDGAELSAQLTRDEAERLELAKGQIVFVKATRATAFRASPAA